jgi:hypothetical protein
MWGTDFGDTRELVTGLAADDEPSLLTKLRDNDDIL